MTATTEGAVAGEGRAFSRRPPGAHRLLPAAQGAARRARCWRLKERSDLRCYAVTNDAFRHMLEV
jgi:hypothetical protein